MRIAIRVDATCQIGTGHFMRCLTLADALNQQGAEIRFVSHRLPEQLQELIVAKGHGFASLKNRPSQGTTGKLPHSSWLGTSQAQDATETIQVLSDQTWDWLVVDHYALDIGWESAMRPEVGKIMVIDDLADRLHDCDLLLDQNYFTDFDKRYEALVPAHAIKLLGPKYSLLRPEFHRARATLKARSGLVKNILVFFGGVDATNETAKAMEAIKMLDNPEIYLDVVLGSLNPHRISIENSCKAMQKCKFYCHTSDMAILMTEASLSIGGGGATTLERMCMGLPSIVIAVAENQRSSIQSLSTDGYLVYANRDKPITIEGLSRIICNTSPKIFEVMSKRGMNLVDGMGATRVCTIIQSKKLGDPYV